jgi:hypothetical protein
MTYALDTTGHSLQNLVIGESAAVSKAAANPYHTLVPLSGPFFADSMYIKYTSNAGVSRILTLNVDYKLGYIYQAATTECNLMVCGCIYFLDLTLVGTVVYKCQTLGGTYSVLLANSTNIHSLEFRDPETTTWEQVCAARTMALSVFPTVTSPYLETNSADYRRLTDALDAAGLSVHLRPRFLPTPDTVAFIPTKSEIGLGNIDNYRTATTVEAAAGTANNLFVTPQGAVAAVTAVVNTQLSLSGYKTAIAYAATLTVTDPLQMYSYNNDLYIARPSTVPFLTSGIFETLKFQLVSSNSRDKWVETKVVVTGTESVLPTGAKVINTGLTVTGRVASRLVINDIVEAVVSVDYYLHKGKIIISYPLVANDVLMLYTKPLKSRVADAIPYYQCVSAVDTTGLFTLDSLDNIDTDDLRVRLNDLLILSRAQGDYSFTGNVLQITYPLALGDVVEVESLDTTSELGTQVLRNLLQS